MTELANTGDSGLAWLFGLISIAAVGLMGLATFGDLVGFLEVPLRLVFVTWLACLSAWMFSASLRAHAAGVRGLDSSPGWCLVWPWLPLIGSLKVYWSLDEFERSARASGTENWRDLPARPWMRWTWLLLHLPMLMWGLLLEMPLSAHILMRLGVLEQTVALLTLAMLPVPLGVFWLLLRIERMQHSSLSVDFMVLERLRSESMRLRFGGFVLIVLLLSAMCRLACGVGLGPEA